MSAVEAVQIGQKKRTERGTPTRVVCREDSIEVSSRSATDLARALGVTEVTARVLSCRGLSSKDAAYAFLTPSLREQLPDPFTMKNLSAGAELLLNAVEQGEHIVVYSDFDVDGLTSSAQLFSFLKALGASVGTYVPNRFVEGYGLAVSAVELLAKSGAKVLVTVDCGISNLKEIAVAKRLGMKTVVVDHHIPGKELPAADVVIDPAQAGCPFGEHKLAAAGVVWMLLIALRRLAVERGRGKSVPDPKDFLDLAAIGTICDMVPLSGVNRLIAYRGVEALRKTKRIGVQILKEISGADNPARLSSGHISFGLGPRINAAGRLGDANEIVTLLTTSDSKKARKIAEAIDRLNEQRRTVENEVKESCIRSITAEGDPQERYAIAVYGENYHLGVIGIAAQRLVEEYYRPSAVMGPGELQVGNSLRPVIKGSVRGIKGFHVAEVLSELSDLLLAHGGHAQAGGFTLEYERLDEFCRGFEAAAEARLTPELLCRIVEADVRISLSAVDFDLANELARLAPFGVGNPSPVLVSEGVKVSSVSAIRDRHLRVRLSDADCTRNGVAWNMQGHPLLRKDQIVNVAYQVELNSYQGISSVQLNVKEVWPCT